MYYNIWNILFNEKTISRWAVKYCTTKNDDITVRKYISFSGDVFIYCNLYGTSKDKRLGKLKAKYGFVENHLMS